MAYFYEEIFYQINILQLLSVAQAPVSASPRGANAFFVGVLEQFLVTSLDIF